MARHVLSDRYELSAPLGRGGAAEVWQGFDRWLERPVAVKMLHRDGLADPASAERFEREARTVAALSHPNIVAMYDVGADRDGSYLVMELVPGRSLAERLTGGPLATAEAIRIAVQVCAALEAAAAAGVVHRDVKPANILLTEDGRVKVCDFGIARVPGTVPGELTGSRMLGTGPYMAPEQVTGSTVDARTDLYGLGCVLYAMLTGRPPYPGDDPWNHVEGTPAPLTGVPADLDTLVRSLLAKYPADRPAGPGEVRAALERLGAGPKRIVPLAVVLTGIAVAVLFTVPHDGAAPHDVAAPPDIAVPQDRPAPPSTPAGARSAPPAVRPTRAPDPVAAATEVIDDQVRAGNLAEKDARKLRKQLEGVGAGSARASDLRGLLNGLHRSGRLRDPGYAAVLAAVARIGG